MCRSRIASDENKTVSTACIQSVPFCEDSPASDIGELIRHIRRCDDVNRYVYRGQCREYPRPLLPSVYRAYPRTSMVYGPESSEFQHSERKTGQLYIGLEPIARWFGSPDPVSKLSPSKEDRQLIVQALESLVFSPRQDAIMTSGQLSVHLEQTLGHEDYARVQRYERYVAAAIDAFHRNLIRDIVFGLPLGPLLGSAVAQQYGFSAQVLDVTTSPEVAAFFATHQSPRYDSIVQSEELGVIYCFEKPEVHISDRRQVLDARWRDHLSGLCLADLVAEFEDSNPDFAHAVDIYREYALDALETGDPQIEYLAFPKGWLEYSRIGRQGAAILIPDEIRKPYAVPPKPFSDAGFAGLEERLPQVLAVEDLCSRRGTAILYFRHGGRHSVQTELTREFLWPSDSDFFLFVTKALLFLGPDVGHTFMGTGYPHTRLPRRPDLVDSGYVH
jgi:hypothetical protein